jgi:lactaldehyde dehydrogenase/glycolaldehyde dehydrogenase
VGILPWNFPFFLIARKIALALVTGNTIVIKPSEETRHSAVKFCQSIQQLDLPPGLINVVHGQGMTAGQALASSPRTGLISFTGSAQTAAAIMRAAAADITKVNLELQCKAPAIVMADADIDLAVRAVTASRIINSGQVCNCVERVYVQGGIADEFSDKLTAAMKATRFGDPLADESVDYGPLINEEGFRKVDTLVQKAIAEGAIPTTGGTRGRGEKRILLRAHRPDKLPTGNGHHPQRSIWPGCTNRQSGRYRGSDQLCKRSEYGLTSSIYTRDLNTALRACQEIQCGETYVNRENFEAMQRFYAGWRKSGIGGADGKHGLYEFLQTHVVYLQRYQEAGLKTAALRRISSCLAVWRITLR